MLTIDANVFVSARVRTEANQLVSSQFLNRTVAAATIVWCPSLVLPETAAAIIRSTGRVSLANSALSQIVNFPYLTLLDLSVDRARQASEAAITCRLRGADAVYVAVAQEYSTTLITWDQELLTRGGGDSNDACGLAGGEPILAPIF